MIFKLFYTILHFILLCKWFCQQTLYSCYVRMKSGYGPVKHSNVVKNGRNLNKLPKHLGLIFTEDELCISDISKILYWCFVVNIPEVSVYDLKGRLKEKPNELEECTRTHVKQNTSIEPTSIVFHDTYACQKSGLKQWKMRVTIVSSKDGRQSIVEHTKQMSNMVLTGHLKSSDIDTTFVDSYFQERSEKEDPDLVFQFGRVESLLGYLPWQMRLTEILSIPTHHKIDHHTFYKTLNSFGSIKQRFGK